MRLAAIQFPVFNPYGSSAVELYIQGCTRACEGCHNPELQSFDGGTPLDTENIQKLLTDLKAREEFFDVISITGGDLLCQDQEEAFTFVETLMKHFPKKTFWLFTGAEPEQVPAWCYTLFHVLKTGVYNKVLAQNGFPSSANQKVFRI